MCYPIRYHLFWDLIRSQEGTELEYLSCKHIALLNLIPGKPEGHEHRIRVVVRVPPIQENWSKLMIEIEIMLQGASILCNISACLIKRQRKPIQKVTQFSRKKEVISSCLSDVCLSGNPLGTTQKEKNCVILRK